jgi:hypothetical protein
MPRDHVRPYRLQRVALPLRRGQGPRLQATSAAGLARAFQHLATAPRESRWRGVSPTSGFIVYERISSGGLLGSGAEPAEVTRTTLLAGAYTVILLHEHPAGSPEPSPEDCRFTRETEEALRPVAARTTSQSTRRTAQRSRNCSALLLSKWESPLPFPL